MQTKTESNATMKAVQKIVSDKIQSNENKNKKKGHRFFGQKMLHAGLITATISHRDSSCRPDRLRRCFRSVDFLLPKEQLRPEQGTGRATGSEKSATKTAARWWAPVAEDRKAQPDGDGAGTNCNDVRFALRRKALHRGECLVKTVWEKKTILATLPSDRKEEVKARDWKQQRIRMKTVCNEEWESNKD
jgi:hypothetical protein